MDGFDYVYFRTDVLYCALVPILLCFASRCALRMKE